MLLRFRQSILLERAPSPRSIINELESTPAVRADGTVISAGKNDLAGVRMASVASHGTAIILVEKRKEDKRAEYSIETYRDPPEQLSVFWSISGISTWLVYSASAQVCTV